MIINFAWKKYLLLTKKVGHDEAIKQFTKQELNSIYTYHLNKNRGE
jgi:hypothetical protein